MKKKIGLKTIKSKMICYVVSMVLLVCAGLAVISYAIASNALSVSVEDSMQQIVKQGANTVRARIENYYEQLEGLASNGILQDYNANKAQIEDLLAKKSKEWGYTDVFFVDRTGVALRTGINLSSREYFQKALSGKNSISDPMISKSDNSMAVFVAVPVKNAAGSVIGVLVSNLDGNGLSSMITDLTFAKTGRAFIINGSGTFIAHYNKESVLAQENNIELAKNDKNLAELAALLTKMTKGEKGMGQYYYKGAAKFLSYDQVGAGTSWSIALAAPRSEVFESVYNLAKLMASVSAVLIILSILGAIFIAGTISRPIRRSVSYADKLAEGDLTFEVDDKDLRGSDELGVLARSFKKISDNMNEVLFSISTAAEQVSGGAKQIADSSMSLSQGATEQASSLEQLSASIEEISVQTNRNAEDAKNADKIAGEACGNANKGSKRMEDLLGAMSDINASSNSISRIIRVIDDIAFQTNILALNAAVEAARAGQYGKGFAVVAEEVRNLAARSANAAKETTALIEGSIANVENGAKIAQETAEALKSIVAGIEEVALLVKDIATASNEQATGISQVTLGISQVSTVVQANSAVSEESAASSEEMSAQARLLNEQIQMFKLKGSYAG